jgi:hypothetical protein
MVSLDNDLSLARRANLSRIPNPLKSVQTAFARQNPPIPEPCREMSGNFNASEHTGGPHDANDTDEHPKHIQQCIGGVFSQSGAPGKRHGIARVKNPHE